MQTPTPETRRPIRIAHMADTHLGYRALPHTTADGRGGDPSERGENIRQRDVRASFQEAIVQILEAHLAEPIDLFVHAGDVFNSPTPKADDIAAVIRASRRLEEAGIYQIWIAGNHDMPGGLAHRGAFEILRASATSSERAYFMADPIIAGAAFEVGGMTVQVDGYPHGAARYAANAGYHQVERREDAALRIAIAHGEVDKTGDLHQGQHSVPIGAGSPYDYIALGHIHNRYTADTAAGFALMPGPTERYGWRDQNAPTGWVLATLDPRAEGWHVLESYTSVTARPMIDLGELEVHIGDTTGYVSAEILNRVLSIEGGWIDPPNARGDIDAAIWRIHLTNYPPGMRHIIHNLEERFSTRLWHLQIDTTEAAATWSAPMGTVGSRMPTIEEMFTEFLTERSEELGAEFGEQLRERGISALEAARALEASEAPA